MSNIDDMIVSMKFDNAQFEAGIKTTLSSLNGLKQSISFDASVKNLNDLNTAGKNVKLDLDSKGFTEGVKDTTASAAKLKRDIDFGPLQSKIDGLKKTGADLKLKFDSTAFGQGVSVAATHVDSLKKHLNFDGAIQSLASLSSAGGRFNLEGMGKGVDTIASKFQNLQVVGIAAIATLTAKAVDAGIQMANKMFVENPKAGLEEYETNLNSIQTILANTKSKGTTLDDVNAALSELNTYSDSTVYNFAQMADSIGKFTSAGVDLKTSTSSIKGFANVAALSGANSEAASGAMQELSKAMSSGVVRLEDWMSFETRGMSSEAFRNSLLETARVHGVGVDDMISKEGSFRNSLKHNWISTEIMSETLSKFTGDMTDAQLASIGYTDEQIRGIQETAKSAKDSATVVKTASALMGTLAETTQSGWAATWQIVIGDFEEAKALWSNVNKILGTMIGGSADRRNKLLQGWKDLGGRDVAIEALSNAFKALMGIITPIGKAFREVFPPTTAQKLYDITVKIRDFTAALIPGEKATTTLYTVFKIFFGILKIGVDIVFGIIKVIGALFGALFAGPRAIAEAGGGIGDFLTKISAAVSAFDVSKVFDALTKSAEWLGNALYWVTGIGMHYISKFARVVFGMGTEGVDIAMTRINERIESFGALGEVLVKIWDRVKKVGQDAWKALEPLRTAVQKMFTDIGQNIKEVFTDVNFDQALDLVNTGLFAGLILLIRNFFKKTLGMGDGLKEGLLSKFDGMFEGVVNSLDGLTGVLKAMQTNLQADTLMKIAIAIGVLTASVVVLSMIDSGKLTSALVAMTVMFTQLGVAMKIFEGVATGPGVLKMPVIAAGMILLGIAILILAGAVKKLAGLEWGELIKGLTGVLILLGGIAGAIKFMGPAQISGMVGAGVGMIAIAIAIKILASAVKDFADISWGDMIQGLVGVGAVLVGLALFSKYAEANKGGVASGVGLILLGTAIKILASAVGDFAGMNVGALIQGMVALGAVLIMMTSFTGATSNMTGIFKAAVGLVVLGGALKIIASALGDFGAFSVETLIKGLVGMAGALVAITAAMMLMPPNMPVIAIGLIGVGLALKIIASAVGDMGGMSWDEIGRGLTVLAASLILIAAATLVMTTALPGAAAMLVVAAALGILAPVLQILGNFEWAQLGMAMAMLAGVFILFGLAGLVLAPLTPVLMGLGIAIGLVGIGLMAAGIGVLAFATGLILLATIGSATIPVIVGLVEQILGLIPTAMRLVGEGIVEFANVLGNNVPVFVAAMVKLLMGLLEAINTVSGPIIDTLIALIKKLLEVLVANAPNFLDMGLKLIVALLQGIADNIDDVVIAAVNIVVALLNGIADRLPAIIDAGVNIVVKFLEGVGNSIPKLIQAGADLVIDFVNGVADGIRNNTDRMNAAGQNLGSAIIDGMTAGIRGGIDSIVNAAKGVADSAVNAAKNLLGIKSPSRVFRYEVGEQIPAGMALGITAKGHLVDKAAEGVGTSAVSTLKRSISHMSTVMNDVDMDMSPTIRPVLDLSSVRRDAGQIGNLVKSPSLVVDGSYAKASSLVAQEKANREAVLNNQNGSGNDDDAPTTGQTFNQYNYSPKALSTTEIYRNTNNQFSNAKGALIK